MCIRDRLIELYLQGTEVLLQMDRGAGSDDGDHRGLFVCGAAAQPGQRDLDRAGLQLIGGGKDSVQDGVAPGGVLVAGTSSAEAALLAPAVLPGQQPSRKRGVQDDTQPVGLGHRKQFPLRLSLIHI